MKRATADLEIISWSWYESGGSHFVEAKGQVKNISGRRLENVEALVTFMTKDGSYITSASALIDYNPILPGQTSPFNVIETRNPAMSKASIEFKFLLGGSISTFQKSKKE